MRIVAIDPGNDRTGFAVYEDGALVESDWFCPWDCPSPEHDADRVYLEIPQNGTHASRGGVREAGGMAIANLNVRRPDVRRVTPNKWRAGLGLLTKGAGKPYYVLEARKVPGAEEVEDHNEAEAILIGKYACLMEGEA